MISPKGFESKLEKIYSQLPHIICKKKCHTSCGPILMSEVERERIKQKIGRDPFLQSFDEFLHRLMQKDRDCMTCPLLKKDTNLCTIYDIRPLICRLFGLVKKLRCPHGCIPSRWLTDKEAKKLIDKANRLIV